MAPHDDLLKLNPQNLWTINGAVVHTSAMIRIFFLRSFTGLASNPFNDLLSKTCAQRDDFGWWDERPKLATEDSEGYLSCTAHDVLVYRILNMDSKTINTPYSQRYNDIVKGIISYPLEIYMFGIAAIAYHIQIQSYQILQTRFLLHRHFPTWISMAILEGESQSKTWISCRSVCDGPVTPFPPDDLKVSISRELRRIPRNWMYQTG